MADGNHPTAYYELMTPAAFPAGNILYNFVGILSFAAITPPLEQD